MFDDNYAVSAAKLAGHGASTAAGGEDEDNDFTLQQDPDKPGFVRWAEALSTRHTTHAYKSSIGYWDNSKQAVALTITKGKKHSVMGFSDGGQKFLWPEEALYLLDDGQLLLLARHPLTGEDLRPGICKIGDSLAEEDEKHNKNQKMQSDDDDHAAVAPAIAKKSPAAGENNSKPAAPKKWVNAEDDLVSDLCDEDDEGGDEEEGEDWEGEEDEEAEEKQEASGSSSSSSSSALASAQGKSDDQYLPFFASYSFLISFVPLHLYLVYCHLKSMGLVALRHQPALTLTSSPSSASAFESAGSNINGTILLLHPSGQERRLFAPARQFSDASKGAPLMNPSFLLNNEDGTVTMAAPGSSPATASAPSTWSTTAEAPLTPVFDVYCRDGINTFRASAPGPPDFFVLVQKANECPPTPSQMMALSLRLARYMATLRQKQRQKASGSGTGAAGTSALTSEIAPSFSEMGGGGGVAGSAMQGRGKIGMRRAGFGGGSGAKTEEGEGVGHDDDDDDDDEGLSEEDALLLQQFSPNIKTAIVAHTAITFYSTEPIELKLPQKYRPRAGGPMQSLVAAAAYSSSSSLSAASSGGAAAYAVAAAAGMPAFASGAGVAGGIAASGTGMDVVVGSDGGQAQAQGR